MSHQHEASCVCDAIHRLECLFRCGDFVAIATTGGDIKFGWVEKVDDGLLGLKFVAVFSPACPCEPILAPRVVIPLSQVTDVLVDPDVDGAWQGGIQQIQAWRQREARA